jgi:hypothetical protein
MKLKICKTVILLCFHMGMKLGLLTFRNIGQECDAEKNIWNERGMKWRR